MSFCVVVFDSDYAHPRGRSFLVSTGLPPEAEIRESSEFRAMIALQPTMQPMWHDDQIFSVVRFDIDKYQNAATKDAQSYWQCSVGRGL
jgi:hypothetical protein